MNEALQAFAGSYPDRVLITTVKPEQVHSATSHCDYGLLLRHPTITNQVASPVKVAEYLQAGLKVIITSQIGDYSELIATTKTGFIWEEGMQLKLPKITDTGKEQSRMVVKKYLTKESEGVTEKYRQVIR